MRQTDRLTFSFPNLQDLVGNEDLRATSVLTLKISYNQGEKKESLILLDQNLGDLGIQENESPESNQIQEDGIMTIIARSLALLEQKDSYEEVIETINKIDLLIKVNDSVAAGVTDSESLSTLYPDLGVVPGIPDPFLNDQDRVAVLEIRDGLEVISDDILSPETIDSISRRISIPPQPPEVITDTDLVGDIITPEVERVVGNAFNGSINDFLRELDKYIPPQLRSNIQLLSLPEFLINPVTQEKTYITPDGQQFVLDIVIDDQSTTIAPLRYAIAKSIEGIIILRGESSFSSSADVLLRELKFQLDSKFKL